MNFSLIWKSLDSLADRMKTFKYCYMFIDLYGSGKMKFNKLELTIVLVVFISIPAVLVFSTQSAFPTYSNIDLDPFNTRSTALTGIVTFMEEITSRIGLYGTSTNYQSNPNIDLGWVHIRS